jgi:hypothetical protein
MHEPLSSHSLFRSHAHATHAQLEALSKFVEMKGPAQRRKALQRLEEALLAHLRAEEEWVLPDFGLVHASEAARIRAAHECIRQRITRMNSATHSDGIDDHTVRELSKLIRECASFEELVLYPWAEHQLRTSKKGEFSAARARFEAGGSSSTGAASLSR